MNYSDKEWFNLNHWVTDDCLKVGKHKRLKPTVTDLTLYDISYNHGQKMSVYTTFIFFSI